MLDGVKRNDRADILAGNDSCGSTAMDMLESREMTEHIIYWRAKTPVDLYTILDMLESRIDR